MRASRKGKKNHQITSCGGCFSSSPSSRRILRRDETTDEKKNCRLLASNCWISASRHLACIRPDFGERELRTPHPRPRPRSREARRKSHGRNEARKTSSPSPSSSDDLPPPKFSARAFPILHPDPNPNHTGLTKSETPILGAHGS
jgi:hypothetical protein